MENMFGDILSDLSAALVGGMGMAPCGEIGREEFEQKNVTWAHDPFRNDRAIFFGGGKEYRIAEISPEI